MLKLLLLNGPPGCGKDEVAKIATKCGYQFTHLKFSAPLKEATCALLGKTEEQLELEKRSDPRIRKVQIALSEDVIKPLYGKAYFGHFLGNALPPHGNVIVSDSGFNEEATALRQTLGDREITYRAELWHIYRPGCSFKGDSRSWVSGIPRTRQLENDGSLEQYELLVAINLARFFSD
jgi:hypothetical protein